MASDIHANVKQGAAGLASNNDPADHPESQPSDLFSSVETRAMLEEFRELVRAGILRVTPENEVLSTQGPAAGATDPKRPVAPPSREDDVAALDKQLLEWLERRRQQKLDDARMKPPPPSVSPAAETVSSDIRDRVISALVQRILEIWERADAAADPHHSLMGEVVQRLTDELLRRWQRHLE
jgi:hypothetical protein